MIDLFEFKTGSWVNINMICHVWINHKKEWCFTTAEQSGDEAYCIVADASVSAFKERIFTR